MGIASDEVLCKALDNMKTYIDALFNTTAHPHGSKRTHDLERDTTTTKQKKHRLIERCNHHLKNETRCQNAKLIGKYGCRWHCKDSTLLVDNTDDFAQELECALADQ